VPALEVAHALAERGARIKVWYAQRPQTARLVSALTQEDGLRSIELDPIPMDGASNVLGRLWRCTRLWSRARRCFRSFAPDVVVGFGGLVSAPVVLAARLRRRRIAALLHEQNAAMGRANRLLARWVDRVALSFPDTQARPGRTPAVLTGLPIRPAIGGAAREDAADRFGLNPDRPTILVLGGSQGARAVNRLMTRLLASLSPEERAQWQFVHLTGTSDEGMVRRAYAAAGATAWVAPFLGAMGAAYAHADLVIARAGASTIAELACCGIPAILIPYPFAGGHQRANASLVKACGAGVVVEESSAGPERVLGEVRRLLADPALRRAMGRRMRTLHASQATTRLSDAIAELAAARAGRDSA
jgi:UDP-N-acetylglucosamine--N-acetylmuramyl-(pentapeptide) pyrophosphoryl-undecaprenol N-acetylglucosamine transferase